MECAPHPDHFRRRGILFVVSSPSGAGKSTISRKLLAGDPQLTMSVSATTRPPRPGEVDGVDYHFVTLAQFKDMVGEHGYTVHEVPIRSFGLSGGSAFCLTLRLDRRSRRAIEAASPAPEARVTAA